MLLKSHSAIHVQVAVTAWVIGSSNKFEVAQSSPAFSSIITLPVIGFPSIYGVGVTVTVKVTASPCLGSFCETVAVVTVDDAAWAVGRPIWTEIALDAKMTKTIQRLIRLFI